MAKTNAKLIECLRSGNLAELKSFLRSNPEAARQPQAVGEAARLGWIKALDLLVKNGADLNASYHNYRPLHSLIQEKPHAEHDDAVPERLSVLKWMLANGADPELLGGWPATRAIITAAFVGERSYVEELRRADAVVDGFVAAAVGDLRHVRRVLAKDAAFAAALDPGGLTALHCAAGSRLGAQNKETHDALIAVSTLLLDQGADPNARVRSWRHDVDAIYFAVASGQREIFELLLARGCDPTAALTPAVWSNLEFAEICLRKGAKPDLASDEGKPLLNQMIRWGQFKQAQWLLAHGASANIADERGWTAVHQAASRGNEKMLNQVLSAGGDPSLKDYDGNTPFDIARAPSIRNSLRRWLAEMRTR